ncbi:hypothetical protein ACFQY5_05580 [Paeniroseomonas aquatica]|uniref:Glycosyltransferase RgtA/B/C/D-like domain-containing protein n=1 Tax=Paeniroseomonas aquatica TaxID=373043 RepID=A0ABT8AD25_9PROT|nr:hypothetical protein [Paeniroseomonas aquatica]MDN3567743.1 hypothetical protein [Paeniroseomonas aquatica]
MPISTPTASPPAGWPALILHLALAAAVLTLLGLAGLWLQRNPMLNTWDEVMHMNFSLADSTLLRSGSLSALRDALFLENRWLPPGLRLLGLPVAALAEGEQAAVALRLAAAALTLATGLVIYLGLLPIAGLAGAAGGALLFVLSPLNLVGAQAFMTELVLHLTFALALVLLLHEALGRGWSFGRMLVLGPVMGLGALAKLTFLPIIGLVWLACAGWRWWVERDAKLLALRLALPAVGLALVAWPHYLINGPRYAAYAKATALGYAYAPAEERGLDFLLRALGSFTWDMLGPGGAVLLLAALGLAVLGWRRLGTHERVAVGLAVLAAVPPVLAYLLSRNQTERYLGLSVVALAFPLGIAIGAGLRGGPAGESPAAARGLTAGAAAMALVQVGLCWAIALGGPAGARALRPIDEAAWRANPMCDFRPVARLLPLGERPLRIGVFGLTLGVHAFVVEQAFLLHRGGPSKLVELVDSSTRDIDWPKVMAEVAALDLVLVPEELWQGTGDIGGHGVNAAVAGLRERLAATGYVEDLGAVAGGADAACAIRALAVRPHVDPAPPRPLLRPEIRLPVGVAG